jgi:DNA-binding NarL/FixJ family response regulator
MQPDSVTSIEQLSPREFDIFCHLAQGKTAHNIANELCLAYKTVANHTTQIKNKLRVNTAAELTLIAILANLIQAEKE